MIDKNKNNLDEYISLSEAAKGTGYTPEHLNLLCRKNKLRSKKIGRNWFTTKEWLDLFLKSSKTTNKRGFRVRKIRKSKRRKKSYESEKKVIIKDDAGKTAVRRVEIKDEHLKVYSSGIYNLQEKRGTDKKESADFKNVGDEEIEGMKIKIGADEELSEKERKELEEMEAGDEGIKKLKKNLADNFKDVESNLIAKIKIDGKVDGENRDKEKSKKNVKDYFSLLEKKLISITTIYAILILAAGFYMVPKYIEKKMNQKEQLAISDYKITGGEELKNKGLIQGEEDTTTGAIPAGVVLASENYQVREVNIGGDISILNQNQEKLPLDIYDIRSEALSVKKGEEVKLLVSWKTNKMAVSELEYFDQNKQSPKLVKEDYYGFNHSVVLGNLELATAYIYNIKSRDRWGNEIESDRYGAYTGSRLFSIIELIIRAFGEIFGWAMK